ncbi:MAG: SAM-dependent chlorinase/fluorinase [Erysipelotrichaceae bacterium]|nr:SAM-dependent chlorinase/fluorinase [Erysipelotrichaceae bacterium]
MKLIAMMSDWTYAEGAIGACKGVIKSIDPLIDIIDITHEIPNYDIYAASYRLKQVLPFGQKKLYAWWWLIQELEPVEWEWWQKPIKDI